MSFSPRNAAHGAQHLGGGAVAGAQHLGEGFLGGVGPVPGVVEGLDLRGAGVAGRPLEQDVVAGVRVERRVEVDEVDARGRDVVAQDLQVVAVVEVVHGSPVFLRTATVAGDAGIAKEKAFGMGNDSFKGVGRGG